MLNQLIKLILILTLFVNLSMSESINNGAVPSIMLSTSDTITFIYPSEMGYEKDYLHIIFKLISPTKSTSNNYRIEDAVFDNRTWSIYLIVSNSSGGSDLIRLKRHQSDQAVSTAVTNSFNYEIDSNWSFFLIHSFNRSKLLSIDINVNKRRLYLFEFNKHTKKYSIILFKLTQNIVKNNRFVYYTFNYLSNKFFKNDGYLYITIVKDNIPYLKENEDKKSDLILFISNNQTLNICFLSNMTCMDYFRQPILNNKNSTLSTTSTLSHTKSKEEDEEEEHNLDYEEDEYYNSINVNNGQNKNQSLYNSSSTQKMSTTARIELSEPLYTFGRLMSIKYDWQENALYLNDYGYDCIYKLTFSSTNPDQFKLANMETILKTDLVQSLQSPLNPIMSFIHDSHIYWIDYEEGLKTIVYKSSCVRTIYKTKEPVSLKLIYLSAINSNRRGKSGMNGLDNSNNNGILNKLIMLKDKFKYKYPPDYYIYNNKNLDMNGSSFNNNAMLTMDHQNLINKSKSLYQMNLFAILLISIIKIVC